jgi:hypothetical protein
MPAIALITRLIITRIDPGAHGKGFACTAEPLHLGTARIAKPFQSEAANGG